MTKNRGPIIVGYDGTPDAELALLWAITTATRAGADLRVVVASRASDRLRPLESDREGVVARTVAAAARDLLETSPEVPAHVVVERDWALPALLQAGADARLVVVGSGGHSRLGSRWLGSVSHHLASLSPCPVAVIRPAHDPVASKIVVGVDGSVASTRALQYAAERARLTGESVLAVHAYPEPTFRAGGAIGALAQDFDSDAAQRAEAFVADMTAPFVVDYPEVTLDGIAVPGHASEVLIRLSGDASLVVIGSRGRTPLQELLLGSVAQETLHGSSCSVIVVR